jgi:hypothetical protein
LIAVAVLSSGCASSGGFATQTQTPQPVARDAMSAASSSPLLRTFPQSSLSVPTVFAHVCGHPGREVAVTVVPVTIPRALCDLTGVVVDYGFAFLSVPSSGRSAMHADGPSSSSSLVITVDPSSGDVTIGGP